MSLTEPTYDDRDLPDALESAVMALLRTPQIRQGFHDLLRTYGIVAQTSEVVRNQNQQVQALAEAMTLFLGRMIEHERRSVRHQSAVETILDLLQNKRGDPSNAIAQAARDALALLQAEADVQMELIEVEAARARTLLRVAQSTARADLADAVATAQTLRETAGEPAADAPAPADTEAQTLRAEATEAAEAATETAAAAAAQTLRAAAAETAAVDAEAREV